MYLTYTQKYICLHLQSVNNEAKDKIFKFKNWVLGSQQKQEQRSGSKRQSKMTLVNKNSSKQL